MIDFTEEFTRLIFGLSSESKFTDEVFAVSIDVRCPNNSRDVLDRVRGVLAIAIRNRLEYSSEDDEIEPPDIFTVDEAYWEICLPRWFLKRTPFGLDLQRSGVWTVECWLYWFLSEHQDRAWRWLSGAVITETQLLIEIQVADMPFPWEALRWALIAAGADTAELSDDHLAQ